MVSAQRHIGSSASHEDLKSKVIRLDETMINRIAAGEVIERPASVVKELLENSIDSGAGRIEVTTGEGGKSLIRVSDDGEGMRRDDLALAVERHCTSKLTGDLLDIRSLGFRGEALPSIGSVAELKIISRHRDEEHAWQIIVSAGRIAGPEPAALTQGTVVEVTRLFHEVPARLKFLKSDRAEANAISEVFKRTAVAFPEIRFAINGTDRAGTELPATDQLGRLEQVMGNGFRENAFEVDGEREGARLTGFAGLPTFNRGNALQQYFFVNGRPVRDKLLLGAVRGAYSDFLARDRHPILALFIDIDPQQVDVNVHPAKADVRFRDPGMIRGLIVGTLKQAIHGESRQASREGSHALAAAFKSEFQHGGSGNWNRDQPVQSFEGWSRPLDRGSGFAEAQTEFETNYQPSGRTEEAVPVSIPDPASHPLGAARAQVHKNYIISQTEDGLIIVDQHAAHERIVYEKLKQGMREGMASQLLLVPEIVDLPEEDVNRLAAHASGFAKLGLELEAFGPGAVAVRATPAMLGVVDVTGLIHDLADEIAEWGKADELQSRLEYVAATMACHGSVRSGRLLKADEMNALLRQMEETPNSGQCNHGRPTYIELDLKTIERLFGR